MRGAGFEKRRCPVPSGPVHACVPALPAVWANLDSLEAVGVLELPGRFERLLVVDILRRHKDRMID